jgi:hypothetical protein
MMPITRGRRLPRAKGRVRRARLAIEGLDRRVAPSPTLPLPPPSPVVAVFALHPPQPCISEELNFHPPDPCLSQGPSFEPPDPCIAQGPSFHPPSLCIS